MSIRLRTFLLTIISLLASVYVVDFFLSIKNSPEHPPTKGTRIAAGAPSGTYYDFTKKLSDAAGGFATIIKTAGSVENISLLARGEADFAIVQSDTAYFNFKGYKNLREQKTLRLVAPLFEEKIRLYIPVDGSIASLRDLSQKNICVGAIDSGTYLNAIAVLNVIGLIADVDFTPIYANVSKCLKLSETEKISAIFQTSHFPIQKISNFHEKILPLSVIDKVLESQPYFRRITDGAEYHLAVEAYLVTTKGTSKKEASRFVYALTSNWAEMRREIPSLPIKLASAHGKNIPKHSGVRGMLEGEANPGSGLFLSPWLLSFWTILLLLCVYAERQKSTYNRLGESTLDAWADKIIVDFFGKFSQVLIAVCLAFFAIVAAVFLLKFAEQIHANSENIQSQFLDLNFVDSLMWLFSYISSGFTTQGVYPISTVGQIIVSILAIAGVLGPFTAIIFLLNTANKRAQRKFMGLGSTSFKNHVLLCGWNEKASGIIYTLTGQDVDERKKVVVIGELDSDNPFEAYNFDPKFVSFVRGAPSDLSSLNRANAKDASAAIILADLAASEEKNADSVLTAMHIRRANSDIHICSELEYEENSDLFKACGSDVVIDAHNIITRLAATAISSPEIIDYVLDTVSYHNFDELYSVKISEEGNLNEFVGLPLRELEIELLHNGINVVGLLEEETQTNTMTLDEFSSMSNLTALVDRSDSQTIITKNSVIVFASKDRSRIKKFKRKQTTFDATPLTGKDFKLTIHPNKRIFACGDQYALKDLKANLSLEGAKYDITAVDIVKYELNTYADVLEHVSGEYDTVVILLSRNMRASFVNEQEMHNIDARNVLITRLVQKVFEKQKKQPTIISEILEIKNKQLFIDAGAEIVLPSSLTVERFLTKEVFDNTSVLQYVLALLNRGDGIYLHSHLVSEDDGFCGVSYKDILFTEIEGLRIVGWLPKNSRESLKNVQNDFDYHFHTVIDDRNTSESISSGDVLILIIRPRNRYYTYR